MPFQDRGCFCDIVVTLRRSPLCLLQMSAVGGGAGGFHRMRTGAAARGMQLDSRELCEGGREAGGFFCQSSVREECSVCVWGRRGLCEGGGPGGAPRHTCSEPGHLGLCRQSPLPLLRSRASSALAAQDPVAMEIQKAPQSIGGTGLPSAWFEAGGGEGGTVGQQRVLLGPCQAQHHRHRQHGSHWL